MTKYTDIGVEKHGHVGLIEIRKPPLNFFDVALINQIADALVGRVFTLEKPIIDGSGTVRIDDTFWRVAGPDAPAGSRVKIVHADGASLTVAAA